MFTALSPTSILDIAAKEGRRFGRTQHDRDEYTQVAALALCEAAPRINEARAPRSFAHTTARNAILDAIRKERPTVSTERIDLPSAGLDPQTFVPDQLDLSRMLVDNPRARQGAEKKLLGFPLNGNERQALSRLRHAA